MCRWKDRLPQLPPDQQQSYLSAEARINTLFAGLEDLPQTQTAKMLALDSAYIQSVRPPEGVSGCSFDNQLGLWLRQK